VLEAQDGEACLATYQHCQPDAILLDAVMPVDGCSHCGPSWGAHACVDGTVLDDPDAVERAFAVGATDYITKPIHWAVLRHRVATDPTIPALKQR